MCSTTTRYEYKGYKIKLQEKVFHGSIEKMNVTLMALSRQVVSLELKDRPKEPEIKRESLFYYLTGRDRSKWLVSFDFQG